MNDPPPDDFGSFLGVPGLDSTLTSTSPTHISGVFDPLAFHPPLEVVDPFLDSWANQWAPQLDHFPMEPLPSAPPMHDQGNEPLLHESPESGGGSSMPAAPEVGYLDDDEDIDEQSGYEVRHDEPAEEEEDADGDHFRDGSMLAKGTHNGVAMLDDEELDEEEAIAMDNLGGRQRRPLYEEGDNLKEMYGYGILLAGGRPKPRGRGPGAPKIRPNYRGSRLIPAAIARKAIADPGKEKEKAKKAQMKKPPPAGSSSSKHPRGREEKQEAGRGRGLLPRCCGGRRRVRKYWPVFIISVSIAQIAMMIVELVVNGGFEPFAINPFGGPSAETLKKLGAKYTPAIIDDGEAWRFFTAIFLHSGIGHLILNLLIQIRLGWTLERSNGFWRVAPIYILSGFVGNVASCIFLPNIITVGASGAIYGLGGVLVSDLMQNWGIVDKPWLNAIVLAVGIVCALAIGLLPGIDNFAHIFGLIEGVMAGIIFIPSNAARVRKCYRLLRRLLVLFAMPVNAFFIAVGVIVFYYQVDVQGWCEKCELIDCVPILNWCDYGKI